MLSRTVVLLIILLCSMASKGQDWVYAGSTVGGDKYYIRNSSVTEYGNKKVWSKQISKTITYKKNGKTYTLINGYVLDLMEYDCSGRQTKLLSFAYYNSKGVVVHSYQFNEYLTEWNDVLPDSVGEVLLDKVCELF